MTRRRRSKGLGIVVLPVVGALTVGKIAIGVGAAWLLTRKKSPTGGGSTSSGGGSSAPSSNAPTATNEDARKADANFAAALATATGLVSATLTAATSETGPVGIAAVNTGLAIDAGVVTALWRKIPPETKARVWQGTALGNQAVQTAAPVVRPGATGAAQRGGMSGLGIVSLLGQCSNPSPGFNALMCFLAKMLSDNFHAVILQMCAVADTAVSSLRSKGIAIPSNWDSLSCDQKTAFLVALGPYIGIAGPAFVAVGAVAAAIQARQTQDLARSVSKAASQVGGAVSSAVKSAADAASHAAGQVSSEYHKVFGGLSVETRRPGR